MQKAAALARESPSMANGVGLRLQSLRGSWVRIPPPAPSLSFLRAEMGLGPPFGENFNATNADDPKQTGVRQLQPVMANFPKNQSSDLVLVLNSFLLLSKTSLFFISSSTSRNIGTSALPLRKP